LGYICGKGVKTGRMKEKNKKGGLERGRPRPYPVGAVPLWCGDVLDVDLLSPLSAGVTCCGHALTCMPLCHEGGSTCAWIFIARRLGGIVAVTPLLWRYGCRRGRVTGVMTSQGVVLVLLLTMHDHVHPIDGSEFRSWGPRGSLSCRRVPRAPRARRKHVVGGQALLTTSRGLGRGGEMSPKMSIVPEVAPQGSGEIEFIIRALSG
jgi:hypothetical protein